MRIDKLTNQLQISLSDAQSLALGKDHNSIEPLHLLSTLIDQKNGSIKPSKRLYLFERFTSTKRASIIPKTDYEQGITKKK